jgi:hypothetical protein
LVVLAQHSSANPKDIIMDTKYTFTGDIFGWLGEATPEKLKEGLFNRKGGAPEEVVAADPARDMAQMTVAALGGEDAARKFMINPVTLGPNDYSDLDAWTEAARQSAERVSLMRMERVFDGPEGMEIPPVQPVSTSSLAPASGGSDLQSYTDGADDVQSIMPPQGLMSPDIEEQGLMSSLRPKSKGLTEDGMGLLDFIGTGEGGYDSANRGTIRGNVIGSQMIASRGGKKVSELTVAEIKKYQSITDPNNKDRLFTVGKYQAIPDTFNQAVKGLGLPDDTVFTPEVQEKVGLYLVSEKRPKVGKFLRGEGDVTTDTAMLELAKEFASIPVPFSIPKGKYGKWPKTDLVAGDSFYKNPKASKGNRAGHTVAETRAVLEAAKR